MSDPIAIVARARSCAGARFRLHGRDPKFGLDCVGLAAIAYDVSAPSGYAMRGSRPRIIGAHVAAAGLAPIATDAAGPGDLVLIDAGHQQYHLGVLTDAGFVHADAGLRRVVEVPGRPAGVIGAWRKAGAD